MFTLLGAAACDDDEPLAPKDAAAEVRPDTATDTTPTDTAKPDTVVDAGGDAKTDVPNLDAGADTGDAKVDTTPDSSEAGGDTGGDTSEAG
jgi:hypothetical protein